MKRTKAAEALADALACTVTVNFPNGPAMVFKMNECDVTIDNKLSRYELGRPPRLTIVGTIRPPIA